MFCQASLRKLLCFSFQLSTTNFKDDVSLASLLQYINSTFAELKHHEEIEDSCILTQLQHRLINKQILAVVNDVHKDNRVLEILSLTRKGLKSTSKSRPRWNRHTFEDRLKEALQSFQKDFLPHMKHEEEVFSVSLYFLYANQHTECELKKRSLHLLDNLSDSLIYELEKDKGTQLLEARQEKSKGKRDWNAIQDPCNKAHKYETPCMAAAILRWYM